MTTTRPRAAIYARFSTDLQNARSAEDQARVCREYASRNGFDVAEVHSDLAISGTTNQRPGLNALLARAEAGAFELVIAEALDRVARDQADIATIFKRLQFAGVELRTVSEGEIGELHVGVLGTMNALFVKELGNKIRRGAKGAVSRGRVPGGICYGYEPAPVLLEDGTIERGHRRIVEAEAAVIRRIFADYLAGISPKAIAHQLNREGVPAPRSAEWRANTITGSRGRQNGILYNPAYDGRIVYGRVRMKKNPNTRKRVSRVTEAAERVEEAAPHLRIVDPASWAAVQAMQDANAAVPYNRQRRERHVFSGLVRCGVCGGSYTIVTKDRWGCIRRRESGTCINGRRIGTAELESRVLGGLQQKLLAPEVVSSVVKRYHDRRAQQRRKMAAGLRAAEARVDELKAEIRRLVDALAAGAAIDEIKDAIASRKEALAIAEVQLREHEALPTIVLHPHIVESYRRKVKMLGAAIVKGEQARKFAPIIRALVETITITDDPTAPDRAAVNVTGSLDAVLAIAGGDAPAARPRTMQVVAEEGLEPPTPGL
jgi:site-specific DNA recombinase